MTSYLRKGQTRATYIYPKGENVTNISHGVVCSFFFMLA